MRMSGSSPTAYLPRLLAWSYICARIVQASDYQSNTVGQVSSMPRNPDNCVIHACLVPAKSFKHIESSVDMWQVCDVLYSSGTSCPVWTRAFV